MCKSIMEQLTRDIKSALIDQASEYTDRDAFVSDAALSSAFAGVPEYNLAELAGQLAKLWDISHADAVTIRSWTGLAQAGFSSRYGVPKWTLENWEGGKTPLRRMCCAGWRSWYL